MIDEKIRDQLKNNYGVHNYVAVETTYNYLFQYSKKASFGKVEDSNTFGLVRAEVLGALVNAVFLMALCFSIFVEALKRLIETDSIKNPDLVLIVGAAGLFINLVGLFLFQGKEIYYNSIFLEDG